MADKFGDNGITGCIMVNGGEIDTLLLSCRILGKGIEHAYIKKIIMLLQGFGITELKASYLSTLKNGQVADFYDKNGFVVVSEDPDGTKHYALPLANIDLNIEDYYHITIK